MREDIDIGIVRDLQERRESVVANLSPAAKHRAFPKVYARPLPPPLAVDHAGIARLQREKDELVKENSALRATITTLQSHLTTSTFLIAQKIAERKNDPDHVIAAFLIEFNARHEHGDEPWTLNHLKSARRSRSYSMPRHVCMWLVRQLCTQISLPQIGKRFGNRDHTSAMHACARAPHWLLIDARMKGAADATLLRFGGRPVENESAETDGAGAP